ncbi:MAG: hypothetical protein Q8L02_05300, partial [Candidatus Nitrotoga sp.]|nr:hypothetical protein [Candidatus Nitrotoga sp.]
AVSRKISKDAIEVGFNLMQFESGSIDMRAAKLASIQAAYFVGKQYVPSAICRYPPANPNHRNRREWTR